MNLLRFRTVLVALLVIGLGAMVFGQEKKKAKADKPLWFNNPSIREELGLSAEQIQKLEVHNQEFKKRLGAGEKRKVSAYGKLMALLERPQVSEEQFVERSRELQQAWADQVGVSTERWLGIRNILTLEQWDGLKKLAPREVSMGGYSATLRRGSIMLGGVKKPTKEVNEAKEK